MNAPQCYVIRTLPVFSQLGTADGETSAIRTAGLIKSETAVRINYRYTYKHFHTFVLKEMTSSKAAKSNKNYVFISKYKNQN